MKRAASLTALLGLVLLVAGAALRPASACAPAFRRGASVRIANESVLIVWDAKSKTQHFIRRATFDTETPDFGFLVPTPTRPKVTEAPHEVFATLEDWTKPEVITRVGFPPRGGGGGKGAKSAPGGKAPPPAVRVLDSGRVGNLLYDVLAATDAKELTTWLNKNDYATRPALTEWLKKYVDDKWVITAFKIIRDKTAHRVSPKAMRLTFQTDKPFHPYREPEDLRSPGLPYRRRLMRVFFIGPERVKGSVGLAPGTAWRGRTVWANQLEGGRAGQLVEKLKLGPTKLPARSWLTVFEDSASPRPGTDEVYFTDTAPGVVKRPPIIRYVPRGAPLPKKAVKVGSIEGKITYKGDPLSAGKVAFYPEKGKPVIGKIAPDGTYSVANVPVGQVRVVVKTGSVKPKGPKKQVAIPAKYARPETSALTAEVKTGKQTYDIVLD